ncbi:3-oxoacyl-[acyl-carrier-protein] synthase III C-terminal domain-containing protein [Streptomyces sp. NPDC050636]|uniref:type III polyketide synthase n=1 Tax=Streptomyces sp. NPDC050636 TaxID=3154510 RepID=UPI0034132BBD
MAVLSRPVIQYPRHILDQQQVLALVEKEFSGRRHADKAIQLIKGMNIDRRYGVIPTERLLTSGTLEKRVERDLTHALSLAVRTAREGITAAGLTARDIDSLIFVHSTGYGLPSLDAPLTARLGLRRDVRKLTISQSGCAGGAVALARARDDVAAHPGAHVLIVAVELCSLLFHEEETKLERMICCGLFGDGCAAAVVSGEDRDGIRLNSSWEYLLPDSLCELQMTMGPEGFGCELAPGAPDHIKAALPELMRWWRDTGHQREDLKFLLAHTGGPRILRAIEEGLALDEKMLRPSYATLRESGNTASVSVLDAISRGWDSLAQGDHGMITGFGPGMSLIALEAQRTGPV